MVLNLELSRRIRVWSSPGSEEAKMGQSHNLELAAGVEAVLQQANKDPDGEQRSAAIQKTLLRKNAAEIYEILFANERAQSQR